VSKRVLKTFTSGEFHYVFGEVYAPDIVDTDGESMSAEDIQKMAHDFIAKGLVNAVDTDHNREPSGAQVVESFIARKDDPDFREGAWVLGVRMTDGPLWERVQSGDINSFSVDAFVTKIESERELPFPAFFSGNTEGPVQKDAEDHTHAYFLQFGPSGEVVIGRTSEVKGHSHEIRGGVITEEAAGHTHRYFMEHA